MQSIQQRINTLVDQWQDYCLPDKIQICKPKVQEFLTEIDELLEKYQNKKQKSKLYYLRGKVMDLLPVYEKSAEEYLNKSIKLNPTNGDCWNVLAHILFKKTDYDGASKAIHMAIQTKGKNKVSLRYQSVLMRTQGKLDEDRRKNIQQSLKVIKQALVLDMKDWATWYFLGNAYLSNFVANFKKVDELQNAIKSYNEAEKYLNIKYPDLYLNRANVEMHLQDYEMALKDLKTADQIDSTLGAKNSIQLIRNRMQYTKVSFERMNELKQGKVQQMMKTIPNSVNKKDKPENQPEITSIKNLKVRYNPGKMLSAKVITRLTKDKDIPTSFLAMDSQGQFLCISLYNVNNDMIEERIKKDSLVNVSDPEVKNIQFEGFKYDAVQVFEITKIWVDKVRLTSKEFNPNVVYNETFQK